MMKALVDRWCSFGQYARLVRGPMRIVDSFYEHIRDINVTLLAHVQWIEERLIKAVQPAPSSLKVVSIRISVTCSAAPSKSHLPNKNNSALSRPVDTRGIPGLSVMALRDSSPLSLGGVKMTHGRSDLNVLLEEEASMASGQECTSYLHANSLRFVRYRTHSPSRPSLPGVRAFRCAQWRPHHDPIRRTVWLRLVHPSS
ncbi:hypothetical protein K503DRAFT_634934 [Rhizopogon vinicolor AM-OR11-026]|uniref:Uncharacterized protein n=1 Tax=Rhizopogon vinicolor AM-OR11-026 TaxID=1314800 RepID=A0A1B7N5X4_9AGAM|nr:hypothetical protein K503DRAFT_634934 [Rhizopogon vinicolor AM-OR11-026]